MPKIKKLGKEAYKMFYEAKFNVLHLLDLYLFI